MEAYFSAKTEMYYLTSIPETLLAVLNQLSARADQIVRQQGGPELTVIELEQRKQALLQPFQKFNQEQVNMRWGQYEQKAKEIHTKAEVHLATLKPLIPAGLHEELVALFIRLSAPFQWNLFTRKRKACVIGSGSARSSSIERKTDTRARKETRPLATSLFAAIVPIASIHVTSRFFCADRPET